MFVELHMIQNFAPSNLNRDENGQPKYCWFGGTRRARVSSQSWKRAVRDLVRERGWLGEEDLGDRSKRFHGKMLERLVKINSERSREDAGRVIKVALTSVGLKFRDAAEGKEELLKYLVFLSHGEQERIIELCDKHYTAWLNRALELEAKKKTGKEEEPQDSGKKPAAKLPPELKKIADEIRGILNIGKATAEEDARIKRAADVAMFGRMIADIPEAKVDAACQVAHPISTHEVNNAEFDYFTALDDLKKDDVPGADMIGYIDFNSACYYLYANVNINQLVETNLNGDRELAPRALEAFLKAFTQAIPTGKKNTLSTPTQPALVLTVVRQAGLWSLANAFERAIPAKSYKGLIEPSIVELDKHFGELLSRYGKYAEVNQAFVYTLHEDRLNKLAWPKPKKESGATNEESDSHKPLHLNVATLPDLIEQTVAAAFAS